MTQRCRLLLGGVCDRPHALCEPQIGWRLDACLERVAPAPVGELHLLDRDTRIAAHDSVPAAGPTAMMWSAICRGAGVGPDARLGSRASCPWAYAGDASDISVRSTSDRRTRHSRPTRTARSRPVLIQIRTVAGWIFSSALTCGTVSHGSSPATGVLEIASGIECVDGPRREIYQLGKSEHRRAHNGGILRRRDRGQSNGRSVGQGHRWNGAGTPLASLTDRDACRRPRDGGPVRRAQGLCRLAVGTGRHA